MAVSPLPIVLPNPLREGLAEERVPEPAVMVIFGASGELAHRKLPPAPNRPTPDPLPPEPPPGVMRPAQQAPRAAPLRDGRQIAPGDQRRRLSRGNTLRLQRLRA